MNGERPMPSTQADHDAMRDLADMMRFEISDKDIASAFARHDSVWLRWFKRNAKRKAQGR